jgi:amidohydrolase
MLKAKIHDLSNQFLPEAIGIRRHLHAHPELSFVEYETSAFVSRKLTEWGIEHRKGYVETGIVAHIYGKDPGSKITALRADMDALPILEANAIDYKSTYPGVMHACGHDVHTASLLGAAWILEQTKEEWHGTMKLIFQPGEEKLPGGASLMIKEGALENPRPTTIIGQHVYPELPAGKVGFKQGIYMASADEIRVTIQGKGGHAAMPHLNIDPIIITAQILMGLQQLVSRRANPGIPTVLSFGKIEGLGATNIIPDQVKLEGTLRTFDEEWRMQAHRWISEFIHQSCKANGATCEVDIMNGYPFLINDPQLTERKTQNAKDFLGAENVVDLAMRMTAEDFAYFSQEMPGCFYRLGTSSPDGKFSAPVHNSYFNIDETALRTGMGLMAWLACTD